MIPGSPIAALRRLAGSGRAPGCCAVVTFALRRAPSRARPIVTASKGRSGQAALRASSRTQARAGGPATLSSR